MLQRSATGKKASNIECQGCYLERWLVSGIRMLPANQTQPNQSQAIIVIYKEGLFVFSLWYLCNSRPSNRADTQRQWDEITAQALFWRLLVARMPHNKWHKSANQDALTFDRLFLCLVVWVPTIGSMSTPFHIRPAPWYNFHICGNVDSHGESRYNIVDGFFVDCIHMRVCKFQNSRCVTSVAR